MRANRGISISELAKIIYGSDTRENKNRLWSLMNTYRMNGKVRRIGTGQYEVVEDLENPER
jgi:hypothetical protein